MIENRWKKVFAGYDSSAVENLRQELCAELKKTEQELHKTYEKLFQRQLEETGLKQELMQGDCHYLLGQQRSFRELREALEEETK